MTLLDILRVRVIPSEDGPVTDDVTAHRRRLQRLLRRACAPSTSLTLRQSVRPSSLRRDQPLTESPSRLPDRILATLERRRTTCRLPGVPRISFDFQDVVSRLFQARDTVQRQTKSCHHLTRRRPIGRAPWAIASSTGESRGWICRERSRLGTARLEGRSRQGI